MQPEKLSRVVGRDQTYVLHMLINLKGGTTQGLRYTAGLLIGISTLKRSSHPEAGVAPVTAKGPVNEKRCCVRASDNDRTLGEKRVKTRRCHFSDQAPPRLSRFP